MPSVRTHCTLSTKRTGRSYGKLHEWMDESAKTEGLRHRLYRHTYTPEMKEVVRKKFGKEAVIEWLFHIAIDNLETAYKLSKNKNICSNPYNYFEIGLKRNSFIALNNRTLTENEIDKKFSL